MKFVLFPIILAFFISCPDKSFATGKVHHTHAKRKVPVPPVPRMKPNPESVSKLKIDISKNYKLAVKYAKAGRWIKLNRLTRHPRNDGLEKVLYWLSLKHSRTRHDFNDIAKFVRENPVWPERTQLVKQAELLMSSAIPTKDKNVWFTQFPPKTVDGHLKWIKSLEVLGAKETLHSAVVSLWKTKILSRAQLRYLTRRYKEIITPAMSWDRLDWLLWKGYARSSQRMYPYVTEGQRKLAEARLRLRHMMGAVDPAIKKIPETLKLNRGLIYERLRWRQRKGMMDKAQELLRNVANDQKFPKLWWKERVRQIRYKLDKGNYKDAFLLAESHIQKKGRYYAEAQWLAGWIATRYVNKPNKAGKYFSTMYQNVATPLSKSRASYWAGRAYEQSHSKSGSLEWYELAASFPTTFYGQLAHKKLGRSAIELPRGWQTKAAAEKGTAAEELGRIARFLHEIDEKDLARVFLRNASRSISSKWQAETVISIANGLGIPELAVYAARRAARKGIFIIPESYPIPSLPIIKHIDKALVLSVIRQESNFDPDAKSRRGALGYMQLLPRTAKSVAKSLKIKFNKKLLTADTHYNITLGAAYLGELIEKFDGNYILALAAYNAGPHNVKKWLKKRGNPSEAHVDTVDWIERIPFPETRNYIQRVTENLSIYRILLDNPPK